MKEEKENGKENPKAGACKPDDQQETWFLEELGTPLMTEAEENGIFKDDELWEK